MIPEEKIQSLIDSVDEVTGQSSSDLTSSVQNLVDMARGALPSGTANNDMLFWDNDNSIWKVKPRWQAYYQPCEYIQSSGTQYIDTGVSITVDLRMVIERANVSTSDCIEGAIYNSSVKSSFSWGNLDNTTYKSLVGSDISTWADSGVTVDTNKHTFEIESGSQKIDDVEYATQIISANTLTIGLFAWHDQNGWSTRYSSKVYSCKFYNGATLIRDYIPVYNVFTGEAGLFDLVNNKFYGNQGAGAFTKGADV